MDDEQKEFWSCVIETLEMIGLFIALTWPILLLFFNHP